MIIYHVYRHYGQYTDRYGIGEYGYFLYKRRAEEIQLMQRNEDKSGHVELEEIEVERDFLL